MAGKVLPKDSAWGQAMGNKWREHLASIKPQYIPTSVADALSPKVLMQVNTWIMEQHTYSEIIRLLGLTGTDPRWQAIRKEIIKQSIPEDENAALLKAYEEQEALFQKLEELLEEVESKLDEKPHNEEERKAQHNYYKYKVEIIKQMIEMRGDRFKQFMEVKKVKAGSSKIGALIIFQSNVPRPETEKLVTDVTKLVGEKK